MMPMGIDFVVVRPTVLLHEEYGEDDEDEEDEEKDRDHKDHNNRVTLKKYFFSKRYINLILF
jgi:hypothetical protein